jgi:hypothetical protein
VLPADNPASLLMTLRVRWFVQPLAMARLRLPNDWH